ncbi:MAG: enoyl-CoA hydratase [Microthrixaceae bacterium]
MSEELRLDVSEGIAVVTLDRPRARNALSASLRRDLRQSLVDLEADAEVRVVILTGADPAFCAGLDLKELAGSPDSLGGGFEAGSELRFPVPPMTKPLVGAVNGVAITGGFELALACDFLVASDRARFADTHARVGIMPGWGLTVHLAEAVGVRRARELSATGNFLDARTAYDWGLVNHVVEHSELMSFTRSLAADIAGNDPAGVAHVLGTYGEQAAARQSDAFATETRRSAEWLAALDPSGLDQRRREVTSRGREQL